MKKNLCTILLALTATTAATAGTLSCRSADGRAAYSFNRTDGGAPRPDIESLSIDGKLVLSSGFQGDQTVRLAKFVFEGKQLPITFPSITPQDYRVNFYVQNLRVTKINDNADVDLLHFSPVICQQTIYVGRPRP